MRLKKKKQSNFYYFVVPGDELLGLEPWLAFVLISVGFPVFTQALRGQLWEPRGFFSTLLSFLVLWPGLESGLEGLGCVLSTGGQQQQQQV